MTSTKSPRFRRQTVLPIAATGTLGGLAGCAPLLESDDDTGDTDDESDDEPLTDYEYTEPPQIIDIAD